ncbi:MAG: pteridine reductase [Gammaproteobacteria bacterium]|nr:MAG: pteridine reductase [Gammaproteobacteria bacterium]
MNQTENPVTGKVALITGAARRIGAEIASTLHGAGMDVCLHYYSSDDEARSLVESLNTQRKNSAHLIKADLHDIGMFDGLIEQTLEHKGRLDLLVNNASTFYPTPVGEISEADWSELMGSNLKAPLFLSQAAMKPLKETNGCVINIVDIHAERPMRQHVVYSIAKAGLLAMTKSLAREMGPEIRVNAVAPGAILWPENEMDAQTQERIIQRTALKRAGGPADIAAAILFLFRDAVYVTGHMLPVDGGRLLNI